MSLSLSNSLSFALIPLAKSLKSSKNSFFSDFGGLFLLVRGVCSKRSFSNFGFFLQEDFFETNLDLSKHPEQVFSIFSYFLNIFFWRKKLFWFLGSWGSSVQNFGNFGSTSTEKLFVKVGYFWPHFSTFLKVQCKATQVLPSDCGVSHLCLKWMSSSPPVCALRCRCTVDPVGDSWQARATQWPSHPSNSWMSHLLHSLGWEFSEGAVLFSTYAQCIQSQMDGVASFSLQ